MDKWTAKGGQFLLSDAKRLKRDNRNQRWENGGELTSLDPESKYYKIYSESGSEYLVEEYTPIENPLDPSQHAIYKKLN